MKDLSIKFAEFVGIETFDGRYMRHDVVNSNSHIWKLYYEHEYIRTMVLYQRFCDKNNLIFSLYDKLLSYENKFVPILFSEYIGDEDLFYFRYEFNGIYQTPYWTNSGRRLKLSTEELFNKFL